MYGSLLNRWVCLHLLTCCMRYTASIQFCWASLTAPPKLPQLDSALLRTVRCHCRFVRHFEAVQLAIVACKWAWALLLCLPFVMAVVLPEHPDKQNRLHWRAQDCGLEAFVMLGLGHMVRRLADI